MKKDKKTIKREQQDYEAERRDIFAKLKAHQITAIEALKQIKALEARNV